MNIYNWDTNTIQFEDKLGNKVNLQLRGNRTIITGESATGKTLLCTKIMNIQGDKNVYNKYNADNIVVLSDNINTEALKKLKNKLIIIDRFEQNLNSQDIIEYINNDKNNKYLIITREAPGIEITPNHVAELQYKNNEFTLNYRFNVKGWY